MATVIAADLAQNQTVQWVALGGVGFLTYYFWDDIKLLFETGEELEDALNEGLKDTKKVVDDAFKATKLLDEETQIIEDKNFISGVDVGRLAYETSSSDNFVLNASARIGSILTGGKTQRLGDSYGEIQSQAPEVAQALAKINVLDPNWTPLNIKNTIWDLISKTDNLYKPGWGSQFGGFRGVAELVMKQAISQGNLSQYIKYNCDWTPNEKSEIWLSVLIKTDSGWKRIIQLSEDIGLCREVRDRSPLVDEWYSSLDMTDNLFKKAVQFNEVKNEVKEQVNAMRLPNYYFKDSLTNEKFITSLNLKITKRGDENFLRIEG